MRRTNRIPLVCFSVFLLMTAGAAFASPVQEMVPVREEAARIKAQAEAEAQRIIENARQEAQRITATASQNTAAPSRETPEVWTVIGNASEWIFRLAYDLPVDLNSYGQETVDAVFPLDPLTQEQLLTLFPFENSYIVGSLKGASLINLADYIASIPRSLGGIGQLSDNIRYTVDARGEGKLTVNGEPVDPDALYIYVTNDYLFDRNDSYTLLARTRKNVDTNDLLSLIYDATIDYLGELIDPYTDKVFAIER